jgi:hypothetical protein
MALDISLNSHRPATPHRCRQTHLADPTFLFAFLAFREANSCIKNVLLVSSSS